jgi:RimJ/RimL family protein N-acetyltransferase
MQSQIFISLDTPRLQLRRLTEADLLPMLSYRNDPQVARYQSWDSITESQLFDFIKEQSTLDPGVPDKWFQLAIEMKENHNMIGDVGLKVSAENPRQSEIGFTLSRSYQKQGLAFEAVSRLFDYLFTELGMHRIIAITDTRNTPSVALLERLGMRCEAHFHKSYWDAGEWTDEFLYAILEKEWLGRDKWV